MNKRKFIEYMKELKQAHVVYINTNTEHLDMYRQDLNHAIIKFINILIYFTEAGTFDD